MSRTVQTTLVKYKVSVEGAEESMAELQGVLSNVSRGIGLVAQLDYVMVSWERLAERADMMGFLRVTLSTISIMRTLIILTKQAEAAQWAYNAALAVGKTLSPWGWTALAAATATAGGYYYYATLPKGGKEESERERLLAEALEELRKRETATSATEKIDWEELERRRREEYRGVVPG